MEIVLKHSGLTARVDTMGGELVSLRDAGGTEYIWGGDPAYWSGRNPILFPIVGALKDGAVRIGGKSYQMDRHGFARRMEFAAVEQGADYAELELRDTAETLARYPFPFSLRVRHQLTQDGFFTRFRVANTGTESMPFCIGAHTAFRCPLAEGEKFEDYRLVFDRVEDTRSILPGPGGCLCHDRPGPALSGPDIRLDHQIFNRTPWSMTACVPKPSPCVTTGPAGASGWIFRSSPWWPSGQCPTPRRPSSALSPGRAVALLTMRAATLRISLTASS